MQEQLDLAEPLQRYMCVVVRLCVYCIITTIYATTHVLLKHKTQRLIATKSEGSGPPAARTPTCSNDYGVNVSTTTLSHACGGNVGVADFYE